MTPSDYEILELERSYFEKATKLLSERGETATHGPNGDMYSLEAQAWALAEVRKSEVAKGADGVLAMFPIVSAA
jgi:hypothetical protein